MTNETSLDAVYRKFGEVSEAVQLLETELGNQLFINRVVEAGLLENEDPAEATKILDHVNRNTLGQLLRQLQGTDSGLDELDELLTRAKSERNRLSHSFYREHNFRRNTNEGCSIMFNDLELMHVDIIEAYKAVLKLSGFDIDKMELQSHPSGYVPI